MRRRILGLIVVMIAVPTARADEEDAQTLHSAGLSPDGPALLAFFRARARTEIDRDHLQRLLRQFAADAKQERGQAMAELLGLGPLALPLLRRTAHDLDHPEAAERATRCLPWLEGPSSQKLLAAAARALGRCKSEGAAAALLAYLPFAEDADVIAAVNAALAAVALTGGQPDPALVRGLSDPVAVRRAAAGIALCSAASPDRIPAIRRLLKDPAPTVRLRTALALAAANDAEAIPVLIDLLTDLNAAERKPIEDLLTRLAGEWAPALNFSVEDAVSRRIRRDAWSSWWRHTDGPALLATLAKHTLTAKNRQTITDLIAQMGDEEFTTREKASRDLFAFGRIALPQIRESRKNPDAEIARRSRRLVERIETQSAMLPLAALRLLALRKPAGSVAALLAYVPHAEDESRMEEVRKALTVLASREEKLDPTLVRALADAQPATRAVAAQVLIASGGTPGREAARKLLSDSAPVVRLRVGMALALARQREAIPTLIDLLAVLPAEQVGEVESILYQLAGDKAPEVSAGTTSAERKKNRDAWASWWKGNSRRVDLAQLTEQPWFGYTLICDVGRNRVFEVDRHGKERWAIENVNQPFDAVVVSGNRVLIAEFNNGRVTERDFQGKILWQKQLPGNPANVQRLPNGNTFIAMNAGPIMEVDRSGKEVYTIPNLPGNTLAARRTRQGTIIATTFNGQCLLLDTTGKQLSNFATNHNASNIGGIDLMANGHILLTWMQRNRVMEFDREGKKLLDLNVRGVRTASALPNGHILAASQRGWGVFEMDRAGKVVWEHRGVNAFRARRR